MKKIIKLLVAASLIFATTTVSAFAQSYRATAWTIRDDVNYALDTRYYKEANVKDFLINTNVWSGLNVNFAKQFDKLYFASSFSGNLWGEINTPFDKAYDNYNNGAILFGFNNMGIYLRLNSTQKDTREFYYNYDNVDDPYNNNIYRHKNNYIYGAIQWGGSFDKTSFVIKPQVQLSYAYDNNKYDTLSLPNQTSLPESQLTKNNMQNTLSLNLGSDFVFSNKQDLKSIFGLNYSVNLGKNEKYTLSEVSLSCTNGVSLSYLINYSIGEKLDIGAEASVNTNFSFYDFKNSSNTTTSTSFEYSVGSNASLGAKYHVIPSCFTICGGVSMSFPSFRGKITEFKTSNKKTTSYSTYENLTANFYTGFEWTPFNNFTIDTSVGFSCGNSFSSTFNSLSIGLSYRK